MRSLSYIIFGFLFSFTMLTACGEGFEPVDLEVDENPGLMIQNGRNSAPAGTTDPAVDQSIADDYAGRMGNSAELADRIVGLDVFFTVTNGLNTDAEAYTVTTQILFATRTAIDGEASDCFIDGVQADVDGVNITKEELVNGGEVQSGEWGRISASVQCTTGDCSELVAIISEDGVGTALYGMRRTSITNQAGETVHRYMSRMVVDENNQRHPSFYQSLAFFQGVQSVNTCEILVNEALSDDDFGDDDGSDIGGGLDDDEDDNGPDTGDDSSDDDDDDTSSWLPFFGF